MVTAASLPLRESAVNLLSAPADVEGSLTVEDSLAFARAVDFPFSFSSAHRIGILRVLFQWQPA